MSEETKTLLKIKNLEETQGNTEQSQTTITYTDFTGLLRAYAVDYQDLDASTERCAAGNTVRDFLQTIRTIKCTFKMQNSENTVKLMNFLKQKDLQIVFYDIETDECLETRVYPSTTRSASVYSIAKEISNDGDVKKEILNNEISVDFIEFGKMNN